MPTASSSFRAFKESIRGRKERYKSFDKASAWLQRNRVLVESLFENPKLRDFIFEPFKGVFQLGGTGSEQRIKTAITLVALLNMVLAGLPGKMGVGVFVSMAFEAWMGFIIAREVGIKIEKPSNLWKYFGAVTGALAIILYGFRAFIGIGFSLFSWVPFINPLILAELFATNLVGILFWQGFQFVKDEGRFNIPKRHLAGVFKKAAQLTEHQARTVKSAANPKNIRIAGERFKAWVSGDIIGDQRKERGEILAFACMSYLVTGRIAAFDGPVGQAFIQSIRDRIPALAGADIPEMAAYFEGADAAQMLGYTNLIKGKMFEHLVVAAENSDGDVLTASLHESETHPGSDMILMDEETGKTLEISLKATSNPDYIEHALARYPEYPILATSEVAEDLHANPDVWSSNISNADLTEVTHDNLDAILNSAAVDAAGVAGASAGAMAFATLWPITMAYLRKRISAEDLKKAYQQILGDSGVRLASRMTFAIALGPVFAWYLLARSVVFLGKGVQQPEAKTLTTT